MKDATPTDSEVILGILNNSETALKRLYVAYFPMVLQLIINNNGNEDDAKDIYQEAIIVVYNKVRCYGCVHSGLKQRFIVQERQA